MTDEEKAENKHWLSQIKLGEWYSNAQYYYRPRNEKERNLMHSCYEEGYNNGFSKGLAEGKTKWHDLRKDPNDLPKKTGEYFTNIGLLYYDELCNRHFWYTPSCEACGYSSETDEDEVIAWCEIPRFGDK